MNCLIHPDYNPGYGKPTSTFYFLMGDEFGRCLDCWKAYSNSLEEDKALLEDQCGKKMGSGEGL